MVNDTRATDATRPQLEGPAPDRTLLFPDLEYGRVVPRPGYKLHEFHLLVQGDRHKSSIQGPATALHTAPQTVANNDSIEDTSSSCVPASSTTLICIHFSRRCTDIGSGDLLESGRDELKLGVFGPVSMIVFSLAPRKQPKESGSQIERIVIGIDQLFRRSTRGSPQHDCIPRWAAGDGEVLHDHIRWKLRSMRMERWLYRGARP